MHNIKGSLVFWSWQIKYIHSFTEEWQNYDYMITGQLWSCGLRIRRGIWKCKLSSCSVFIEIFCSVFIES